MINTGVPQMTCRRTFPWKFLLTSHLLILRFLSRFITSFQVWAQPVIHGDMWKLSSTLLHQLCLKSEDQNSIFANGAKVAHYSFLFLTLQCDLTNTATHNRVIVSLSDARCSSNVSPRRLISPLWETKSDLVGSNLVLNETICTRMIGTGLVMKTNMWQMVYFVLKSENLG